MNTAKRPKKNAEAVAACQHQRGFESGNWDKNFGAFDICVYRFIWNQLVSILKSSKKKFIL